MKQKKRKKEFKDTLIPIILTLSVLPFVTRLIIYHCGLSSYSWFSYQDLNVDFFSYYKSCFFILISIFCGIILFLYFLIYHSEKKEMRPFIPLGLYLVLIFISTAFSQDRKMSMQGCISFESVLVLTGYLIMLIYTYQMVNTEDEIKVIMNVFLISIALMCVVGFLQLIGKDLFEAEWFQKLIMPREYWHDYLGTIKNQLTGNAVSLTLYGPNFAGVYVSMLIPLLTTLLFCKSGKLAKAGYLTLIAALMTILVKTYSRGGLLALAASFLLLGYFFRNEIKKQWKQVLVDVFICMSVFIAVDSMSQFRFLAKLSATIQSLHNSNPKPLQEIKTYEDKVAIQYKDRIINVSLAENTDSEQELRFYNGNNEDISNKYDKVKNRVNIKPFDEIIFTKESSSGKNFIVAVINKTTWKFVGDSAKGYLYCNANGKTDKLMNIRTFGFHNHENIASGRGFIWSRSLPLLKDYLFIGSGPDTFSIVFPQNDYVGKANNCKTPVTLIEKPHSLYLSIGIQTGVVSLISFLCFYILYFVDCFRIYRRSSFHNYLECFGLGCFLATFGYMISGFFIDTSLQTSPVFWVLTGLGMAVNVTISLAAK